MIFSDHYPEFIDEVALRLGGGLIDLDLDPPHFETAFKRALMRYRQRSSNATEESFVFLDLQPDQEVYTLPDEVQDVKALYRRTIGGTAGGAAVDPFSLSFTNNIYMLQNPGNLGGSGTGFLATYDFAMGFQSLVGRMFGREILYVWNAATKKLKLERRFLAVEQIAIHVFNTKPVDVLLVDPYARIWLYDYTVAVCKQIMAEARGKFASLGGPQGGGITLNADALRTEAKDEIDRLDLELDSFIDQSTGWPFIIG